MIGYIWASKDTVVVVFKSVFSTVKFVPSDIIKYAYKDYSSYLDTKSVFVLKSIQNEYSQ